MTPDEANDIQLGYDDDARSVHTLLRIIDPDNPDRTAEVLYDNLTTPMYFIVSNDLKPRQETIGFAAAPTVEQLGGGMSDFDRANLDDGAITEEAAPRHGVGVGRLREVASGPGDDALIIEVYGDPGLLS